MEGGVYNNNSLIDLGPDDIDSMIDLGLKPLFMIECTGHQGHGQGTIG